MSVLVSGGSSLNLTCCYVGVHALAGTRTQFMDVSVIHVWEQFLKYDDQDRRGQMGEEIDETDGAALARQRRKTLEQKGYILSAIRVCQDSKPLEAFTEALAGICFKAESSSHRLAVEESLKTIFSTGVRRWLTLQQNA